MVSEKGQNLYGQKSILNSLKARSVYFEKGLMEVVGESIGKKNNEKGTKWEWKMKDKLLYKVPVVVL